MLGETVILNVISATNYSRASNVMTKRAKRNDKKKIFMN
jgi:hypothetical protein